MYDPTELNWPKHDLIDEYYMDIGLHMVEKHGLFLERYVVWDRLLGNSTEVSSSAVFKSLKLLTVSVFAILQMLK